MKRHEPNLDMLSAYVDGVLSHDAARSMEQHLAKCEACAAAVEAERGFVASLDTLAEVRPPADFVDAVMGRVAQHPIHRPSAPIPWRSAVRASRVHCEAGLKASGMEKRTRFTIRSQDREFNSAR